MTRPRTLLARRLSPARQPLGAQALLAPLAAAAMLFAGQVALAQPAPAPAKPALRPRPAAAQLAPDIIQWSLPNGLSVAFARTTRAPIVVVQVWYRAGSKDEPVDRRGTAHMFEHLMFRGSAKVPPEAHTRYLQSIGGYSNAVTTEDGTAFHNTVPPERLDLVLELEADRMNKLVFRPGMVASERAGVGREIDRNLSNPLYAAVVQLLPAAFGSHPYAWTSGGVKSDLGKIDAEGLATFYGKYYTPSNALVVIAGNVTEEAARAAVAKHFGPLARGTDISRPAAPGALTAGKKTGASGRRLGFAMAGYRIPGASHADIYPLQLLSLILSRGESSRLYRKLVGSKLAVEAGGQAIVREQPGLFMVFGAYNNPANAAAVEKTLVAEMDRIRTAPPTALELKNAVQQARAALGFAVQSVDGLAQQIGSSWALTGDPIHFVGDLERFSKVTLADLKRVATTYFAPELRLVVELPLTPPAPQGAP